MPVPSEHKKFDAFLEQTLNSEDFPALLQFPKEFRRSWLKQFDTRFVIILASTFLLEVGFVISLLAWVLGKEANLDVDSIQKRYASLLLDKSSEHAFFEHESKAPETYLYGVPEEIENHEPAFNNQEQSDNRLIGRVGSHRAGNSASSRSTPDNFVANAGPSGMEGAANSYSSSSAERVGSLGILAYLSDDDNASNEELSEIFAPGGRNTPFLEGSLANVKITNFAPGGERGGTSNGGGGTSVTGIKGAKSIVSNKEIQASLSPLEQASYRTVAKNTEIEESSISLLAKTGSKATARKAEHITRVVLDHNRAIQDCYKQALKKQPDLKGKVVVRFSVTPEGKVDLVEVIKSTIDYEPMVNCIVNRIRRWNDFGESDRSLGTVSYRQTYVFGY